MRLGVFESRYANTLETTIIKPLERNDFDRDGAQDFLDACKEMIDELRKKNIVVVESGFNRKERFDDMGHYFSFKLFCGNKGSEIKLILEEELSKMSLKLEAKLRGN